MKLALLLSMAIDKNGYQFNKSVQEKRALERFMSEIRRESEEIESIL
jgi:hypothetical protein